MKETSDCSSILINCSVKVTVTVDKWMNKDTFILLWFAWNFVGTLTIFEPLKFLFSHEIMKPESVKIIDTCDSYFLRISFLILSIHTFVKRNSSLGLIHVLVG